VIAEAAGKAKNTSTEDITEDITVRSSSQLHPDTKKDRFQLSELFLNYRNSH
jgi:hypothetical protein